MKIEKTFGKEVRSFRIELQVNRTWERQIKVGVAIKWLFSFWFIVDASGFLKYANYSDYADRILGLSFDGEDIFIYYWHNDDWQPRRLKIINLKRVIFGDYKRTVTQASEWQEFMITMPEGDYKAKVKFETEKWTWQRFKKPELTYSADVEMVDLIYSAGKGENSYDLDDDYLNAIYMRGVRTIKECQKRILLDQMKLRKRRGLPSNMSEQDRLLNIQAFDTLGIDSPKS